MGKTYFHKRFLAFSIILTGFLPVVSFSQQTKIVMPKNKYKTSDDIQIGNKAAADAEREFPILNDADTTRYVQSIGERLVAAIPPEFQHPEFNYRFKVVDASDINAFALPGGPMFVNRGMIQAARNEGEVAGVMAHELSHVALRHGTAQLTKQGSWQNQLGQIGMIVGGGMVLGQAGEQIGMLGASAWMTKYSREYESQADLLGAQIMARAGYDPRDLANMFQTIASQGGSRSPQWLSDHPDPGNRYDKINREAQYLQIASPPIKLTRDFERVKSRLAGMPPARSMQQIQADYQRTGGSNNGGNGGYGGRSNGGTGGYGGRGQDPTTGGRYARIVEPPSPRLRDYLGGDWLSMQVPDNWEQFGSQTQIGFAPLGAYGDQGITHGAMVGIKPSNSRDPYQASQNAINELLQGNPNLQQQGSITRATLSGMQGYVARLAGQSTITGQPELVTVYTAMMRNGDLFYIATVAPQAEWREYDGAFRSLVSSVRLRN